MKKIIIGIIIFTLVIPLFSVSGFADTKSSIYSKNEIEKIVREKLDLDDELKLEYSNLLTQDLMQKKFWNMEFSGENTSISVTANAETGKITSFYKWIKDDNKRTVNILANTARNNAINFIKSLEPDKFKETEEVTTKTPSVIIYNLERDYIDFNNYHFTFVRKIKDEFFPSNYFRVQVSGATGEVIQYQMQWDDVSFDHSKNLISENKARDIFEKEDQIKLKYMALNVNNKDQDIPILTPVYVYNPKSPNIISAIDGRFLNYDEIYHYGYDLFSGAGSKDMAVAEERSLDNGGEVIPEEGVLSKEKIENMIINTIGRELDIKDLIVQDSGYFNNYFNRSGKFWRTYWRDLDGKKRLYTVVDAENGDILSLDYYKNIDINVAFERVISDNNEVQEISKSDNIDENKIKKDILNKVQNLLPFIQNEDINFEITRVSENEDEKSLINVDSSRYINNITYDDNYLRIKYDYNTEEILGFSYRWDEVKAQSPSNIIDKKSIVKKFYDTVGLEKYLIQITDKKAKETKGLDIPLKELLPIYTLRPYNFRYVDAVSGKFLDYNGEEYKDEPSLTLKFKDLKGYKYEQEINLMNKMGILKEKGDYFYPNNSLLKKDAIKWIVEMGWRRNVYPLGGYYEYYQRKDMPIKDIDKDDPYYPYIVAAIENEIIGKTEDFKLDEKAEKLEITKWIIRAMKQDELARFTEIFQNPYEDKENIPQEDIGYVALAKYYNLYRDMETNGMFEGDRILTRGEFIKALYNLMNR